MLACGRPEANLVSCCPSREGCSRSARIIDVNLEEAPACRLGFRGLHDVLCERIERGVRSPCGLEAVAQEDVQILASTLITGVPVELKVPR